MRLMPFLLTINTVDCLASFLFLYLFVAFRDHRKRRGLFYPPGPPSRPIIGNLLDVPKEAPWITYADMSKKYGKEIMIAAHPLRNTYLPSKATSFLYAFLVKSWSCCARTQPSRIYSKSVGKPTQIGLFCQSWKCALSGVTIPRLSTALTTWSLAQIQIGSCPSQGRAKSGVKDENF